VRVPRRSHRATRLQSTQVSELVTSFTATTKVRPWLRRLSQNHNAIGANPAHRISLKTELCMWAEIDVSELLLSLHRFSRSSKCPNRTVWIFFTPNFRQIGTQIWTVPPEVRTHPSASRILPNWRWTDKSVKWLLYCSAKGLVECSRSRTDGQTDRLYTQSFFPPSLRTQNHEQFQKTGAEIRVRAGFTAYCALCLFCPLTGRTPLPNYTKIRRGPRRKFWAKEEVEANWRPNIVHLFPSRTG